MAVPYIAPIQTQYDIDATIVALKAHTGSDVIGYQKFFCEPDAPAICEKNVSSSFRSPSRMCAKCER